MSYSEKIKTLLDEINLFTEATTDFVELTKLFYIEFNKHDDYEKCRIIDILATEYDFFIIKYILDKYNLNEYLKKLNYSEKIIYDGKDIGCYVKCVKLGDVFIFKVVKRDGSYLYDSNKNKFYDFNCEELTKSEIRKFKIEKLLC